MLISDVDQGFLGGAQETFKNLLILLFIVCGGHVCRSILRSVISIVRTILNLAMVAIVTDGGHFQKM